MGLLEDIKKGARRARDEADTQMQLARKYAEQVNLQRARKDALSEVGAEVLDVAGDVEREEVRLTPRARALLEDAKRIDRDLQDVKRDIDRLKRGSAILGEGEVREGAAVEPEDVEDAKRSMAPTPEEVPPRGADVPEGAAADARAEEKARKEQRKGA